jgi:signal transduction protein with GAF and PtsI domain
VEIHGLAYESSAAEPRQPTDVSVGNYVEQIKRANQEVFSLYEMARDFGASLNLEETLKLLTRKVSQFVPYDTCLIYLLDDGSETATAAHVDGRNSETLKGKEVKIGEGATGYVLKKRKPVENVDPSLDFAFSHSEICRHYVGMASVPLLAEERLIGAITVFSGKLAVYEEEHLRLLETIARIAGDAISKSIKQPKTKSRLLRISLPACQMHAAFRGSLEKRSEGPEGQVSRCNFSCSTWTGSSRSTTILATRPGTKCSAK